VDNFPGADLPGNSYAEKNNENKIHPENSVTDGEKKLGKVVSGQVTQRRKTVGTRLKEMFTSKPGETKETFVEHLVENVVVPMFQDMLYGIVDNVTTGVRESVEQAIFGEAGSRKSRVHAASRGTNRPRVNYNQVSSRRATNGPRLSTNRIIRPSNTVKDIILETRDDAERVIDALREAAERYGHVTVGDLYETVGIDPVSTDHEWGWQLRDLMAAHVKLIDAGEYLVSMPRPIAIATH
jgi:hypothetical protein